LPAQTKRVVFTRVSEVTEGQELTFRAAVNSPSGRVISAQQGQFHVGGRPIEGLPPGGVDIPVEFILTVDEFGAYSFSFEITEAAEGDTAAAALPLYVVEPSTMSS
jgi:hypothetical protein